MEASVTVINGAPSLPHSTLAAYFQDAVFLVWNLSPCLKGLSSLNPSLAKSILIFAPSCPKQSKQIW